MKYRIKKGILPVLPGDVLWDYGREPECPVREVRISEVRLRADELTVYSDDRSYGLEIGRNVFLTPEEAERKAAKHRLPPPYIWSDRAVYWMPVDHWLPGKSDWYGVRIQREDGSVKRRKAWYFVGSRYPEENGFYESDRRNAARIENVTAWIDEDYLDIEEDYDGKPLDFSLTSIEELDLDIRTWEALKRGGIRIIRDILRMDLETLKRKCVLGRRSQAELAEKLGKAGFEVEWLKG